MQFDRKFFIRDETCEKIISLKSQRLLRFSANKTANQARKSWNLRYFPVIYAWLLNCSLELSEVSHGMNITFTDDFQTSIKLELLSLELNTGNGNKFIL